MLSIKVLDSNNNLVADVMGDSFPYSDGTIYWTNGYVKMYVGVGAVFSFSATS